MLSSQIKNQIAIYKEEIEKLEKQLSIIGPIKKGDICHIETGISYCVAKDGVADLLYSNAPALLRCRGSGFVAKAIGEVAKFDILASEDLSPFNLPYQGEYCTVAILSGMPKKIKVIPREDILLYVGYQYKSDLYRQYLTRK